MFLSYISAIFYSFFIPSIFIYGHVEESLISNGIYQIGVLGTESALTAHINGSKAGNISMTAWKKRPEQEWLILSYLDHFVILNNIVPDNFISKTNQQPKEQVHRNETTHVNVKTERQWQIVNLQPNIWSIRDNNSQCLQRLGKRIVVDSAPCKIFNVNQHWTLIKRSDYFENTPK